MKKSPPGYPGGEKICRKRVKMQRKEKKCLIYFWLRYWRIGLKIRMLSQNNALGKEKNVMLCRLADKNEINILS